MYTLKYNFLIILTIVILLFVFWVTLDKEHVYLSHTKEETTQHMLLTIGKVICNFYQDTNRFPSSSEGLSVLIKPNDLSGRYFTEELLIIWKNSLGYDSYDSSFVLYSFGKNEIDEKGKGDDRYILVNTKKNRDCRYQLQIKNNP